MGVIPLEQRDWLGNPSLYIFSVVSCLTYAALCAASSVQARRHGVVKGGAVRACALGCVAAFAGLRTLNSGAHVVRLYVDMPGVFKHLLFVLPLALAFTAFSAVVRCAASIASRHHHLLANRLATRAPVSAPTVAQVFVWYRIAAVVVSSVPRRVRMAFLVSNALVYVMTLISVALHFAFKGDADEFRVIGWTNVVLAALFIGGSAAFGAAGYGVLAVVRRSGQATAGGGSGRSAAQMRASRALRRVATLMVVCILCFIVSCLILLGEGIVLVDTGSFVAPDGEYTTTDMAEWTLFVVQTLPQAALVMILWRGELALCACCRRCFTSPRCPRPPRLTQRKYRTTQGRGVPGDSKEVSEGVEGASIDEGDDSEEDRPLLGIAAEISTSVLLSSSGDADDGWVRRRNPLPAK